MRIRTISIYRMKETIRFRYPPLVLRVKTRLKKRSTADIELSLERETVFGPSIRNYCRARSVKSKSPCSKIPEGWLEAVRREGFELNRRFLIPSLFVVSRRFLRYKRTNRRRKEEESESKKKNYERYLCDGSYDFPEG